jgi:hypothetical protein
MYSSPRDEARRIALKVAKLPDFMANWCSSAL